MCRGTIIYMCRCHNLLLKSGLCAQKFFANLDVCSCVCSNSWCVFALATVTTCRNQAHLVCTSLPRQLHIWHDCAVQRAFTNELNHLTESNAWRKDRQEAALLGIP